jgi:organic radical activating enzyme
MSDSVKLIECFRTFQGEGPDNGRAMLLLRFKYCNMNCEFCDTSVKMRISEEGSHRLVRLQEQLSAYRCGLMITGGEPTFKPHYKETMALLTRLRYRVANVETNGCSLEAMLQERPWPKSHPHVKFIYSPKVFTEQTRSKAIQLTNSILDHPSVYIKIPYLENDFCDIYCSWLAKEIRERERDQVVEYGAFDNKVWLMPLGDTEREQKVNSATVMDKCEEYKFNFSPRTHIMYDFI